MIPREGGEIAVTPGVGCDLVALVVRVLDTLLLVRVVDARI